MIGLPILFGLSVLMGVSAIYEGQHNLAKVAHSKDDAYYDFRYAVDDEKSGVVADRWESRSGRFVKGAYSLLGPDGKVRSVHYEVDADHGFKAVVRTASPSLDLLSIQSARQIGLTHRDPPINKALVEEPPLVPASEKPFNYHAALHRQRSQLLPSAAHNQLPLANKDASLFSNNLIHRPLRNDDNLQALQDLTPPAVDAYDSYPRPVRTNPNRRQEEPVRDDHRTVYSDYVNKELQRITPLRSARLVKSASRGRPVAVAAVAAAAPPKRNDQSIVSLQPAPFSRHYSKRPRQFLTETSPWSSSYFL